MSFNRTVGLAVLVATSTWLLGAMPAMAATIQVTTTADENGTGAACSLREAVQAAATTAPFGGCPAGDAGTNKITFEPGTTDAQISVGSAIVISTSLQIVGNGVEQTRIDGLSGSYPIFQVSSGTTASIEAVTLQHSASAGLGGGIENAGTLTVANSRFTANRAGNGGGIGNLAGAELTVSDSTFDANSATGVGGGGILNSGTLTVTRSLFSANIAPINGGGINTQGSGVTILINSTFTGNTSGSVGGALSNLGTTNVVYSTLRGNRGVDGSGVATANSNVIFRSSILANGQNTPNCNPAGPGITYSQGGNVADDASCFDNAGTDRVVADVKLGPLANNGGPTATHALLDGSPAIGTSSSTCAAPLFTPTPIATDQRGQPRPVGAFCDAGAFERQGGAIQFSAPTFSVGEAAGTATITVTRSGGAEGAVGAAFSTINDVARAPDDFIAVVNSPVSFANGDTTPKSVQVQIVNDTLVEGAEALGLVLANPTDGASLGTQSRATLTIVDDDQPSPSPVKLNVTKAGAGRLQVVVTAPSVIQTVAWTPGPNFSVEDSSGRPIAGGLLTIPAGSTSTVFYVRRTSGTAVTVPLTVTGGFGTWRTFVGGGADAWQ